MTNSLAREMLRSPPKGDAVKLTVCSLCLRVRQGRTWIDAEGAIRELRSYELLDLPRMDAAVCSACEDEISRRRAEIEQPLAA